MRVHVFIDGFNLYHRALKKPRDANGATYKWLDLQKLASNMLATMPSLAGFSVDKVRYFTARVKPLPHDPGAPARQGQFLRALRTLSCVEIHYGQFRKRKNWMYLVNPPPPPAPPSVKVHKIEEKGSDVNLASYLLFDGFEDLYDAAAVITNDSDLVTPIQFVRDRLKKPIVVFDPSSGRSSTELRQVSSHYHPIPLAQIIASQFANPLTDGAGVFSKPPSW